MNMMMRSPRARRFGLPLAAIALMVGIGVAAIRSEAVRAWMFSATGEENAWEGVKGVGRLAILEVSGPDLELAPDAPIDHLGGSPYGVNTFLQLEADPDVVRHSFEIMRDAGVGWARQHFPWEDIEIHGRGDFEDRRHEPHRSAWDKYDRIVSLSYAYGVDLLARLDDPPDWAYAESASGPVLHKGPPDDFADYGAYVAAVGERYCGQVRYYQLWNEPNIYPEWGEADVDPVGYAELLRVGAEALRAACPDAVVVSAALAQTTEPGGRNMDDLRYLEALYDAGWQDHFDVMAVQAFGLWTGPTDRRVHPSLTNFNRLVLARDIMVARGDEEKAIWITEMGWNSAPEDIEAIYGRVSEENRARYTRQAYERIAAEWPFVGPAFLWFLRRPNEEWHSRPEGWFRIVEPGWATTPTYSAMRELGGRTPVMNRGRHEVDDRAVATFGPWRDIPSEPAHPRQRVGSVGAELHVIFEGTGYRLMLAPDSAATELFVVLDGESETLTLDAEQRSIEVSGLENGQHTLIVRVDGGELSLDEIIIQALDPVSPLRPLWWTLALLVAAIAAAIALLLVVRRGSRGRAAVTADDGSAPVPDQPPPPPETDAGAR